MTKHVTLTALNVLNLKCQRTCGSSMLFHMSLTEFSCFIFTSSFEMPAVFPKVGGWVPKPAKVGMTGFRPSAQGFASTRYITITFNEVKMAPT